LNKNLSSIFFVIYNATLQSDKSIFQIYYNIEFYKKYLKCDFFFCFLFTTLLLLFIIHKNKKMCFRFKIIKTVIPSYREYELNNLNILFFLYLTLEKTLNKYHRISVDGQIDYKTPITTEENAEYVTVLRALSSIQIPNGNTFIHLAFADSRSVKNKICQVFNTQERSSFLITVESFRLLQYYISNNIKKVSKNFYNNVIDCSRESSKPPQFKRF
jgi:hypothetical protein